MAGANFLSTVQPPALLGVRVASLPPLPSRRRHAGSLITKSAARVTSRLLLTKSVPNSVEGIFIGGCVGTAVALELIDSSTGFTRVAAAADLIERRQRSEFQSNIKETLYTAIKAKPELVPSLLTLALNDAITYDKATKTGGANGSIRLGIIFPFLCGVCSTEHLGEQMRRSLIPEGRVPDWSKASVQEMKDRFVAVGLGPRQPFLGPDQAATEERLIADPDCRPWVEKYQRSRDTVSRTDYEVDLITTLTKLSSLGQKINYEAYTYPKQKIDLTKLKALIGGLHVISASHSS
ncbi:hypothetical protein PR202_ga19150 [Eleusine coracana subsp. coracana]|uniref:Uncharacterized protein n=1 Tax=Eleusine coracana subsp. coracana TaxID=191504 RepID=A0AAV5CUS9_ELECO|nr:hypothetical protein PR202_ga19150 [Eleusine coracana subsp. coracana]